MLNLAELNHLSRLELVQWYFLKAFSYKEITMFLANQHSIDISLRQLHRLLHQQHFYRICHKDTVKVVLEPIKAGIDGSSTNLGYGSINQKLRHNGIKTDRGWWGGWGWGWRGGGEYQMSKQLLVQQIINYHLLGRNYIRR